MYIHCILRICIQFAVVVDDYLMGITEVVRGQDLLMSTARQLLLYEAMGYTPPQSFYHCPLLRDEEGRRLAVRILLLLYKHIHTCIHCYRIHSYLLCRPCLLYIYKLYTHVLVYVEAVAYCHYTYSTRRRFKSDRDHKDLFHARNTGHACS